MELVTTSTVTLESINFRAIIPPINVPEANKNCIGYLSSEDNYYKTREKIKEVNISFVTSGLDEIKDKVFEDKKFDVVFLSNIHGEQLKRGFNDYSEIEETIQINLNNYAIEGNKNIIEVYTLKNDDGELLTDKFMVIQIYLANLREKWYTYGIEKLTEAEKALLVFIEPSIDNSFKFGKGIDIMEEFIKDAIKASSNEILLEAYDKEWALKDEGKREGFDDGYDSGFDAGVSQGIEQGIEENKIEMIRNMLKENASIDFIVKVSGLSIEEINHIKDNN